MLEGVSGSGSIKRPCRISSGSGSSAAQGLDVLTLSQLGPSKRGLSSAVGVKTREVSGRGLKVSLGFVTSGAQAETPARAACLAPPDPRNRWSSCQSLQALVPMVQNSDHFRELWSHRALCGHGKDGGSLLAKPYELLQKEPLSTSLHQTLSKKNHNGPAKTTPQSPP